MCFCLLMLVLVYHANDQVEKVIKTHFQVIATSLTRMRWIISQMSTQPNQKNRQTHRSLGERYNKYKLFHFYIIIIQFFSVTYSYSNYIYIVQQLFSSNTTYVCNIKQYVKQLHSVVLIGKNVRNAINKILFLIMFQRTAVVISKRDLS